MKLDRENRMPLYIQLKDILEEKISSNEWKAGTLIPSEKELQEEFDVSRITVRQAVKELTDMGLVYKKQGVGTYVSIPKMSHDLPRLTSFTSDVSMKGLDPESLILVNKKMQAEDIAAELGLDRDTEFIYLKRLRMINGEAVGVHECFLNTNALTQETIEKIEKMRSKDSLYRILNDDTSHTIKYADETLESALADRDTRTVLGIDQNIPVLVLERVSYTTEDTPVEYVKMFYRADKYKYSIRLQNS